MSLIDHPIGQPSLDVSPIWTPIITAEVKKKNYNSIQCRLSWENLCFYVGNLQRICLSRDDFYSDSSLVQGLIRVEYF
jgi:hypothetical protein